MYRSRRRHPLHTFRFWFFIFGAAAVTLAWRFNVLPIRIAPAETGKSSKESFTEVVIPEAGDLSEPSPTNQAIAARQDNPFYAAELPPQQQSEPQLDAAALFHRAAADNVQNPDEPLAKPFQRSASTREASPFAAVAEQSSPAEAVTETGITQTASVSNPFQSDASTAVLQANLPPAPPPVDFTEIDRLAHSHNPQDHIEAHRELSKLYWQKPELRDDLRERIDELAQRIYFHPQPHYMPAYEIQPGDNLQEIGKKYAVPWQYLGKLNRLESSRIRAGQRVKVIKGPFSAVVDLSDFELTIHAHGYYVTRYAVGIGKDGSTPIGTFTVQNKQVDPTYYGPDGVIEHDDPSNPLGERWIDLGNSYGIHGTIDPGSIGRSESRGCIRMHNEDVAAVYDLLGIGSEVTIRE